MGFLILVKAIASPLYLWYLNSFLGYLQDLHVSLGHWHWQELPRELDGIPNSHLAFSGAPAICSDFGHCIGMVSGTSPNIFDECYILLGNFKCISYLRCIGFSFG